MNKLSIPTAAVIYLLMAIPMSQATSITITFSGFPPTTATLPAVVNRQVTIQPSGFDYAVHLSISNATSQQLQTLLLFVCKELDPATCTSTVTPQSYSFTNSILDISLPWSSLADQPLWPKTSNLLLMVKTANAYGGSWLSYWHRVVRNDQSFTPPNHYTADIPSLAVEVTAIEDVQTTKNFIEQYALIPTTGMKQVTFTGADSLYQLQSDAPPAFTTSTANGDTVTAISRLFDIVLPNNGQIMNGITLTQNPSNFLCGGDYDGDGNVCDAGETSANCCTDCGCSAGSYCDLNQGCQSTAGITLEVIPPTNTNVANCNQQNTVTVTLRLNNPPSDLSVVSQSYVLDGAQSFPLSCAAAGNIYTCPITVPADPSCNQGTFSHNQNSISFDVSYSDGASTVTQTLTSPFPNITVGSWACGDAVCDAALGETSANCCADCGCSAGNYCDIAPGAATTTGLCSPTPIDTNLVISNITPSSFSYHTTAGNIVTFDYALIPQPQSLVSGTETCTAACTPSNGSCIASCTVTCSGGACSLAFTIAGYNQLLSYSVSPSLTVPITYNDGLNPVSSSLTAPLPSYTFGQFFCGDATCDAGETSTNCCYDCGCSDDQICNTATVDNPSAGDVCFTDALQLMIDNMTNTSFVNQNLIHSLNVSAHISGAPPNGLTLYTQPYACQLHGGSIPCTLQCAFTDPADSSYPMACQITIPSIIDTNVTTITLIQNALNVTVDYTNGSSTKTKQLTADIGNITITQISTCGNSVCESYLGEDAGTCCIDCSCSSDTAFGEGFVCIPGGSTVSSQCVANTSIQAVVAGIQPQPLTCPILPSAAGGGCAFAETLEATFNITNAPSTLQLIDANQVFEGVQTSASCSLNTSIITCYFAHPPITSTGHGLTSIAPGNETKTLYFDFSVAYQDNLATVTQHLSTHTDFTIYKDPAQIQSCQEKIDKTQEKIDTAKTLKNTFLGILAFIWALVTFEWIKCGICEISGAACAPTFPVFSEGVTSCGSAAKETVIASCISTPLFFFYGKNEQALQKAKAEKEAICQAQDTSDIGNALDTSQFMYTLITSASLMVCLFGNFGAGAAEGTTINFPTGSTLTVSDGSVTITPP